jgi:AraC-like DNA-binding protein
MDYMTLTYVPGAAAVHGIIMGVYLLFNSRNQKKSYYFLAFFLLLLGIFIIDIILILTKSYSIAPWFAIINSSIDFIFPVIFYLFVRSIISDKIPHYTILHFIPFILVLLISILSYFLVDNDIIIHEMQKSPNFDIEYIITIVIVNGYISLYIILAYINVQKAITSKMLNKVTFRLMMILRKIILLMIGIAFISTFSELTVWIKPYSQMIIIFLLSILIYYSSIISIKYSDVFKTFFRRDSNHMISKTQANSILREIDNIIQSESLYLNPSITLELISKTSGYSKQYISYAINSILSLNFNEYINRYRVEEVIKCFKKGDLKLMTIMAIATKCGFNSKSTFNAAFKKQTEMTPKEYIKTRF